MVYTLAAAICLAVPAFQQEPGPDKSEDPSVAFFKKGEIPKLRIELDEAAVESLRTTPREWTSCRVHENDKTVYEDVKIKLKGAAGSTRDFDDKPGLTLKLSKAPDAPRFHGLVKFHLNNAVQDPTYLNEYLGSELFRAAGILAPRITHAHVWLNERDAGLYVLKEGFDETLLQRGFEDATGNLYDGGFCQDIDAKLEKDGGKGPDDHSDLKALLDACHEQDVVKRWQVIAGLLDVETFLTFMAMEFMAVHWDGYGINRNNYRLYVDPKSGKAYFLPHGMDQLFQNPESSILDHPPAILAATVMKNPAWRTAYRKRIVELLPLFDSGKLVRRVDEAAKRLIKVLRGIERDRVRNFDGEITSLKSRLKEREKSLREQKSQPEPKPLVFAPDTPVKLDHWRNMPECPDASMSEEKAGAARVYRIGCGPSRYCVASWRKGVLLPRGKYRFQAAMSGKDIAPLDEGDAPGIGGGLRITGARRDNKVVGTAASKVIEFDFTVEEEVADVELMFELRASKGQIQVRGDSLKLTRLSD